MALKGNKISMQFRIRSYLLTLALVVMAGMPVFSLYPLTASAYAAHSAQNNYVVKFSGNSGVLEAKNDKNISSLSRVFVGSSDPQFEYTYKVQALYSKSQFLQKYGSGVDYIDDQHKVVAATAVLVNDPGFSTDQTNTDRQWGLWKADFPDAWSKTTGSSDIVVALIDTGIDGTHEDLSSGQVGPGYNFITKSYIPLSSNSDDNGHGTLVAGIIGATPNNFRGITGADWKVQLMPLKALDSTGSGNSADVASAIVWATDHGASIINMSLGGVGFSNDTTLSDAISYAFNHNVVLVAAAGNDVAVDGGNLDNTPVFPICDDNGQNMIIGVAATDENDQKTSFSNYGRNCIDVSAPGKRILSTINFDPATKAPAPNSYAYGSGTSLAAPFVSAEAALIRAQFPSISNKDVRDRILKSADSIDGLNLIQCGGLPCNGMLGSGRINAFKALDSTLLSSDLKDGDIVQSAETGEVFYISGGQRMPVSQFVYNQRFSGTTPTKVAETQLDTLPLGPYALPLENTIVKSQNDPTVYIIVGGFKKPVTYQVFKQRNIQNNQIAIVTQQELASWLTGKFMPPVEGTLVRAPVNKTVYWVVDGLLHPINYQFWVDRGLNIFPLVIMPDKDISGFAQGNPYIR